MIHNFDTMRELIDKLNYYTKLYDEGHPAISDKEWDDMYFQLQELEKEFGVTLANSPTIKVDYFTLNQLKKVEHNHPMLSLAKTKSEEDVVNFLQGHDAIAMAKMDGLTCSLRYLDGTLVSAETRGNGVVGEDITHNILFVKGVPAEIPIKDEVIIDGEVICTYKDFDKYSTDFANPRNFAAGSIRLLSNKECASRDLTFITWDCIKGLDNCQKLSDKLFELNKLGFLFVPYIPLLKDMIDIDHIKHSIILLKDNAKEFSYPIDGIVFKYDNCEYYQSLGYTGHHFRGGLAFKFYDEEYPTILRDIEWSMGKTGQITPVAIFDPVDDGESIITRASLHNINIMEQLFDKCPHVGDKIYVCKMNQIIPQIVRVEKSKEAYTDYEYLNRTPLLIPTHCPCCGEETTIKDDFLYCKNPKCEGKFINRLDHFCGKKGLDIKGLSKATLQKLINWGWVESIKDIFTLFKHSHEWYKKDGFGTKSVDNILTAIGDARHCEMWRFLSALSIPLIGSTYAKEICRQCAGWLQFMECIGPQLGGAFDFSNWEGFGPEMNKSLHNFDFTEANEMIDDETILLTNSYWASPEEIRAALKKAGENLITGKTFVITGKLTTFKNRDEAKAKIEAAGGKVVDSVSSKTNYLVNNDINSTSSKNVKAKNLGIPIITESQLLEML